MFFEKQYSYNINGTGCQRGVYFAIVSFRHFDVAKEGTGIVEQGEKI